MSYMNYHMGLRNFLQQLDAGFNPELKPVGRIVIDLYDKLYRLRASGMYSSVHIAQKVEEFQNQVKEARDFIYAEKVKGLESQLLKIKQKYEKELSDSEVNKKLLSIKQFENKLKVLDTNELNTYVSDLQNDKSNLDVDQLNMLASEFKSRNEDNDFIRLVSIMKSKHVDEPWLNEKEYISMSSVISRYKTFIGASYISVDTIVSSTDGVDMQHHGGTMYLISDLVG